MTGRRPLILALAGWLAIVAVGSTMVWTVVAQAGRDVAETGTDTLAASSSTGPSTGIGEPTSSELPSSGQPTGSADPSSGTGTASPGGPDDTASDGGTEPGDDGSPPSPDPTKGQPSGGPSHPDDPDDDTSIAPPVATHRGTWQGTAGTVVASCTGSKISLVAAQPNSGWRVEVGHDPTPTRLSVHFELTEGEDDDRHEDRSDHRVAARVVAHEVEVGAKCSDGRPAFSVDD